MLAMDSESLAILGGSPEVQLPPPHFTWPQIGTEEEEAVLEQLRSGILSYPSRMGIVQEFEDSFAKLHGVPFAMSTDSGTSALHAAFFGLGLPNGSEVLAPAYTHLASVIPMLHTNLLPVLCEVDPVTGNLDPEKALQRITQRTRAIVVTHQYGHICDMEKIGAMARKYDLKLVEDCSHAHGSSYLGQLAGTFGDVGCFSLQSHKSIVAGEGGILITQDPKIYERACLLGGFRHKTSATSDDLAAFIETGYGLKMRLHPLGAALALCYLRKLQQTIASRKENLALLVELLSDVPCLKFLPTHEGYQRGAYFRFIAKYDQKACDDLPLELFLEAIKAEGATSIKPGKLAKPLHLTKIFQTEEDGMYPDNWPKSASNGKTSFKHCLGDFPIAESFSSNTVQFPPFTGSCSDIIYQYAAAVVKVFKGRDQLLSHLPVSP
jgi:perosamine synthetase